MDAEDKANKEDKSDGEDKDAGAVDGDGGGGLKARGEEVLTPGTGGVERRIDIVGIKINRTDLNAADGDKKWVSVRKSNGTDTYTGKGTDNVKVTVNREQ